jgi:MFS family permease
MSDTGEPVADVTAPIPLPQRRGWGDIRSVLRLANFQRMFVSTLAASMAGWMSRVAQDWIILELTGNVALVGLALTFQFLPTLLLGLWGGVFADRFPRLPISRIATTLTAASFVTVAVLALSGTIQVWQIYLVAAITGVVTAADQPARSALITQIVPPGRIQTAVSLNALTFHGSGLLGPALSGVLIAAVGAGWSLLVAGALSLVSLGALLWVRGRELTPVRRASTRTGVRDALRYAIGKPRILWSLVLLAFVATFGMTHTVLYTAAASAAGFDSGATGYGLYMAVGALGAVLGAVVSTRRREVSLRGVALTAIGFGVAMMLAAASPVQAVFVVAVVLLSAARILFGTGAESLVQISTNPTMRGRISALYFVIVTGGQAGGGVFIGWVAQTFGLQVAYAVAGGVPLVAALVVCAILASRRRLTVRLSVRIEGRRAPRRAPRTRAVASGPAVSRN